MKNSHQNESSFDTAELTGRSGEDRKYHKENKTKKSFAIFDGHGSKKTADFLSQFDWINHETTPKEELFKIVLDKLKWTPGMGGSTATIVWVNKVTKKVRILWIGDSPAFVYDEKGKCIFNSAEKCDFTDSNFRDSLTTSLKEQCYWETTAFQRVSPTQVRKLPVYRVGDCNTPSFGDEKKWHNQYNDEGKYSGGFMEKTFSLKKTGPITIIVASDGLTDVYPKPEHFDFTKNCKDILEQYLIDFKTPVYDDKRRIGIYQDVHRDDFVIIKSENQYFGPESTKKINKKNQKKDFVEYKNKRDSYVNFKFKKNQIHDRVFGRVYQPGFSSCFQRGVY